MSLDLRVIVAKLLAERGEQGGGVCDARRAALASAVVSDEVKRACRSARRETPHYCVFRAVTLRLDTDDGSSSSDQIRTTKKESLNKSEREKTNIPNPACCSRFGLFFFFSYALSQIESSIFRLLFLLDELFDHQYADIDDDFFPALPSPSFSYRQRLQTCGSKQNECDSTFLSSELPPTRFRLWQFFFHV